MAWRGGFLRAGEVAEAGAHCLCPQCPQRRSGWCTPHLIAQNGALLGRREECITEFMPEYQVRAGGGAWGGPGGAAGGNRNRSLAAAGSQAATSLPA